MELLLALLGTLLGVCGFIVGIVSLLKQRKMEARFSEKERMGELADSEEEIRKILEALKAPISKEKLNQLYSEERKKEESYSKRMLDFVKWTSTIVVAAILWIGKDIKTFTGWPQIFAISGLIILIISLGIIIYAAA